MQREFEDFICVVYAGGVQHHLYTMRPTKIGLMFFFEKKILITQPF